MSFINCFIWRKSSLAHDHPYEEEMQEPIKKPEDIIDAVERAKLSGDHSEIHEILKNRDINLSKKHILLSKINIFLFSRVFH